MSAEFFFILFVFGLVFGPLAVIEWKDLRTQKAMFRTKAHAQFKNLEVRADSARFSFSGQTAEILEECVRFISTENAIHGISLTRFCRNPEGEYFHFISNDDRAPFLKHVSHEIARIKLKKKYVAPPGDG